jgi:hypothetical protein
MKLADYLNKSKYGFPKKGDAGIESDWMEFGDLDVPLGLLWIGDASVMDASESCTVEVPPGTYQVELKGMDFKGVRVISRVRVFGSNAPKWTLGARQGEAITDCGMIGICDMRALEAAVTKRHAKEFEKDVREATVPPSTCIEKFLYGKKSFDIARVLSGIGDGGYDVYALESTGKVIGVEVEFLPHDYVHDA